MSAIATWFRAHTQKTLFELQFFLQILFMVVMLRKGACLPFEHPCTHSAAHGIAFVHNGLVIQIKWAHGWICLQQQNVRQGGKMSFDSTQEWISVYDIPNCHFHICWWILECVLPYSCRKAVSETTPNLKPRPCIHCLKSILMSFLRPCRWTNTRGTGDNTKRMH